MTSVTTASVPTPEVQPGRRTVVALLTDGAVVSLRPLGNGELAPQRAVLESMSDQSRWQRFLAPVPTRLPASMERALASVDGLKHVAWVAEVGGQPVGLARYVEIASQTAEVAFEVADAHQGRGIGTLLLEAVLTVAHARGFTRISATVRPDNVASVKLLAKVGVTLRVVGGVLEGTSPFRLPCPPRLDHVAVLAAASTSLSP